MTRGVGEGSRMSSWRLLQLLVQSAAQQTKSHTAMPPCIHVSHMHTTQVRRGALVLDPYVGTGSILVAAAARGAVTIGSDIDVRVLRMGAARRAAAAGSGGHDVPDVWSNFDQYGLQRPAGLVRMDVARGPLRPRLQEVRLQLQQLHMHQLHHICTQLQLAAAWTVQGPAANLHTHTHASTALLPVRMCVPFCTQYFISCYISCCISCFAAWDSVGV